MCVVVVLAWCRQVFVLSLADNGDMFCRSRWSIYGIATTTISTSLPHWVLPSFQCFQWIYDALFIGNFWELLNLLLRTPFGP